jgi:hypothetical protein
MKTEKLCYHVIKLLYMIQVSITDSEAKFIVATFNKNIH